MLTMEFDYEKLAEALLPKLIKEMELMMEDGFVKQELPPMLTVNQFKEVLHIKSWKASELLGRPDFPVLREAGVLIPRDRLFEWIDRNLDWVEENTNYFQVAQ